MAQSSLRIITELHDEPHIAARLDLTVAEVYGALECYHSHPEAMAAVKKRRAERETMAKERGAASLVEVAQDE
jgi:hypothetical protein